jgi:hypothetical protein
MSESDSDKREQVARQCAVVVALADRLGGVRKDYEKLVRGGYVDDLLDMIGSETSRQMELLGDVLNGMDAVDQDDEWMTPVFEEARRRWPSND